MKPFNYEDVKLQLVTDSSTAFSFIEWIKHVPDQLIGLDVESDGLDWYDGRLRLVQFGTMDEGWAVPFEDFRHLVIEALDILTDRQKFFVGHNFKFDLHFLEQHAGWLPKDWAFVHDTMLMAAVLNSSGSKALKDLAEFYVWSGAKIGQTALKEDMKQGGWTWGTVPIGLPSYWVYGILDTILTVNLFWTLYERCVSSGVMLAYETERAATPPLYKIERKGMLLDREHATMKRDSIHRRNDEIENELVQYGISNVGSSPQIARALIDAGVELTEKTGTGKWKMDRDTFDLIAATNNHPLLELVKEHRKGTKFASTYYQNFLDYQRSDGRCHPFYRPVVARTGRMSADQPAILTVPRAGTDADVRNSFVAPDGHVLISTDFSNVEARIFAHYANEHEMIRAFLDGQDLHCFTAKMIYQMAELPSKDDPLRQIAKNALFCYPETTKALTQNGPKHVDELNIGDLVAGYRSDGCIDWTPIRAIHRPGVQEVLTFGNDHRQFRATADHRWVAERRRDHGNGGRRWERTMVTTEQFIKANGDCRLILAAQFDQVDRSGLTAGQASLLGWLITDGHVRWSDCTSGRTSQAGGSKVGVSARIAQTKKLGRFEIENLLGTHIRKSDETGYDVYPQSVRNLFAACGLERDYSNLSEIVLRMGFDQISEFCRAAWVAEGTLSQNMLSQNRGSKYDAIRLAVFMNGMFPGRSSDVKTNYPTDKVCARFTRGLPTMTGARVREVSRSQEPVWCITTDLDSFVAVDGEDYFLGGNCTLFGGGAMKVAITAGVPLAEGERAIKGLYAAFPGMKEFQRRSTQTAIDNLNSHGQAFIRGVDNRVLAMVETDDRYYAFTNWMIQSTACVVLKRRLAAIDAMGLSDYCVAAIHDEVVAEIPEDFEEEYNTLIREAMEDDSLFQVPIVSATGKGAVRWGEAK